MIKVMRRLCRILLLLAAVPLLHGCWDNKDINHRSLPLVMGIAKQQDKYRIYLQIPSSDPQNPQMKVVAESGRTVTEAVDRISMNMESQVDLLHLKVILVEKHFAQEGMADIIEGFIRARDISPKAKLVICNESLERFFENMKTAIAGNQTILCDFFDKNAGWNPSIAQTHIWETFRSIHSYTRDVIAPIIQTGKDTIIENVGSAIIKNGKMVDRINPNETLLYYAFKGASTQGKIEVLDHASVLIVNNTVSHHGKIVNSKPLLRSTIRLKVSVLETRGDPTMASIRQELEEIEAKRFAKLFKKMQLKEADILGVGQYFRTDLSRSELSHWRSVYLPKAELQLTIKAIIQNNGNLKTTGM
ncbi:Ger(x)C family germination protein [Paenibacillus phyllosphaerae]|uniref:Ger(X)C family germination protein n=1 Tax=Paenibacillus phyllosphaerae TaxID=274593 RepID=A0A7W5FMH2_9BACL|nr:Ger(x)C family spore germination protein [Paenibacillus phyllosphaerae]MBB3110067.1 Ger(x)C family germination protein [Paenibacillus phyllosphaerae]